MIMKAAEFPYHIVLLPLFFVFHTANTHWLFIGIAGQLYLAALYASTAVVLFLLLFLWFKSKNKAGVIILILLLINFYFSEIHKMLRANHPALFIYRYVFVVPLLVLTVIFLTFSVYRSRSSFMQLTRYLNILFLFLFIAELATIAIRSYRLKGTTVAAINDTSLSICDTCRKPDIYFLLFDEYSSSLSLREDYHYDNDFLDTFLVQSGFKILTRSKSNYNITNFSVASITNMSYLRIPKPDAVTSIDYFQAAALIHGNRLCNYLDSIGYKIENYSLFDIGSSPPTVHYLFTSTPAEIIKSKTFIATLIHETGWNLYSRKDLLTAQQKNYSATFQNNLATVQNIKRASQEKINKPKFVYGHLLLPHPPFLVNKTVPYSIDQLVQKHEFPVTDYVNYVYYTNTIIRDLVTTIQQNTNNEAVIVIMGDHGFRAPNGTGFPENYFENQNAVYFPQRNYEMLYDSIGGVNQFRVILNTLFQQKLPLLAEKQYYLKDRK